jgi:prepilin-type N-terminal cleavage/methylation domain-containing protein
MGNKGLSLVELLVVLLASSILVAVMYTLLLGQQSIYTQQDQAVEMQQTMRAGIDRISRDLRMAGYGGNLIGVFGNVNGFSNIITPTNGGQSDSITVLLSEQVGTLTQNSASGSNQLFLSVANAGDFFNTTTKKYLCLNGQNNYLVQGVSGNTVTLTAPLQEDHLIDEPVFQVKAVTYTIQPNTSNLVRNENTGEGDQLLAEYVEDLQFQYTLSSGTVVDSPATPSDIRIISITLAGRTAMADSKRPGDGYQRQTLNASVEVRNLAL